MGWDRNVGKEPSQWSGGYPDRRQRLGIGRSFQSSGRIHGIWGWGGEDPKQRATALPWQVLGKLSHVRQPGSSLVPRTEPAAGKQCQGLAVAATQLFISSASRPICLWLPFSAVPGVIWRGKLASFLSPWQQNGVGKVEMYKQDRGRSSTERGLT